MIDQLRERVAAGIGAAVKELTGKVPGTVSVEDPPRPDVGDLACPVALQVARALGRNPRQLGQQIADYLNENPIVGVTGWSIAGPGFLNAWLDRSAALFDLVARARGGREPATPAKILVEHTSINPNKAAHIGHLRNSCMGDTLARVYRQQGHQVEVHNYIDDTGVQVADVVIGFLDLRHMSAVDVAAVPEPFDYYCWDLYTEVSGRLAEDDESAARRGDVLRALETDSGLAAEVAQVVVDRVVGRHVQTMRRLGIEYDLLVKEGDILTLDLWAEAFERLKQSDAVYLAEDEKHAGCWMMRLSGTAGFEELEEADKVLVRSNGVATYVAKDIAYHLWKYGLLNRTFRYEPVTGLTPAPDGPDHEVWQTTHEGGVPSAFGNADRAVSVIDVRQSYLQSIVGRAFYIVGADDAGASFKHFAYEMVALSPNTARALGIPVGDDDERQFVEMSGRRGYGVKADDLLDELVRRATHEVGSRNPELPEEQRAVIGRQIAVGAARYFLLKFTRNTVIVFDLDDALSFEGETGPYLQYAAVRASHVFDKLRERQDLDVEALVSDLVAGVATATEATAEGVRQRLAADDGHLWNLILALARLDEVIDHAARSLEISVVAKYAFTLAQHFNRFYHSYPIVQSKDADDQALRILVAYAFQRQLATALEVLGIPLPERM